MPFIQRPNTDAGRLNALEAAKAKADVTAPADLAFSAATLAWLTTFLPLFRTEMQERGIALSAQIASTTVADKAKAKLQMFISHFFQVFNLGIAREVYTAAQRAFFQLDTNHDDVPPIDREQDILLWGNRVVNGDAARVAAGGAAMVNPTAAQVGAELAIYIATQGDQSTKKDAYDQEQEDVEAMRPEADELIADIWDECEFTFRKDSASSKRRKCREYGVYYRPRQGEEVNPDEYSIFGTVKDSVTGIALADVGVVLVSPEVITVTDEHSKYYIPVQPTGTYALTVHKAGYADQTIAGISVIEGQLTTVDIQLVASGTVNGHVSGPTTPGPFSISVQGQAGGVVTDGSNDFSIVAPAGAQTILCWPVADPANIQSQPATVTPGGTVVVNFVFP